MKNLIKNLAGNVTTRIGVPHNKWPVLKDHIGQVIERGIGQCCRIVLAATRVSLDQDWIGLNVLDHGNTPALGVLHDERLYHLAVPRLKSLWHCLVSLREL